VVRPEARRHHSRWGGKVETRDTLHYHDNERRSEQELDSDIEIDEHEVTQIIESIKEAQYFDASGMAPLTPASVVSIYCVSAQLRRGSDMFEGSYRQIEGV
jgi:hypothetical protein